MSEVLKSYNAEIQPRLRELAQKKEELKEFLEGNEELNVLRKYVKDAQDAVKSWLESNDDAKMMTGDIKELSKEIDLAIKAASKATKNTPSPWKKAELKEYMVARSKDEADVVPKTISKGKRFSALNEIID